MTNLSPFPALAAAAARELRDALLLRGWSHAKAKRFAKAKERRMRTRR